MSSELHELFRREIDQIPVRPESKWTPREHLGVATRRGARRPRTRFVARAALVVLLVVASTTAGLLLGELRRNIATNVAAPTSDLPTFIRGSDLVHIGAGPEGPRELLMVAMPEGRIAGRIEGETYVGTRYAGSPIITSEDVAFIPITARPELGGAGVSLHGVDLHTGGRTTVIDAGVLPFATDRRPEMVVKGDQHIDVAPSEDGSTLLVVRDTGVDGSTTVLERYDARTGARLASRRWNSPGAEGLVWARLVALDGANAAVVRNLVVGSWGVTRQDWHFVDADLNEVSSLTIDDPFQCGFYPVAVIHVAASSEWLILCSDPSGFLGTQIIFVDENFRETARLDLARELGFATGATVMADGTVAVVTRKPLIARIDPRTHSVIDNRHVVDGRTSLFDLLQPSVAVAKGVSGPSIAFSRDGNFAYMSWWSKSEGQGIALIDLRDAAVVAWSRHLGQVLLSPDGGRLYVLSRTGPSPQLVLLDPGTLREVAASGSLGDSGSYSLFMIAVASR